MTVDEAVSNAPGAAPLPLSAIEARILGCLIEKAATTPEVYPLTLNALITACNQKTNREPVMSLPLGDVGHCVREMEQKELVQVVHSSRALRYEHRVDQVYGVTPRQRALLGVLMLRGPQTLNELFTRSERLAQFPSLDDVRDTLERLAQRDPALAICLGRAAGQREDRYMHLLCGPVSAEQFALRSAAADDASAASTDGALADRVDRLEALVEELRQVVAELREQRPPADSEDARADK